MQVAGNDWNTFEVMYNVHAFECALKPGSKTRRAQTSNIVEWKQIIIA